MFLQLLGVESLTKLLHQFSSFYAGATGGICLAVVVELHQFSMVVETGGCGGSLLQKHHPNGEIRNHSCAHGGFSGKIRQITYLLWGKASGANNRRQPVGNGSSSVLVYHLGMGEIHEHRTGMLLAG